MSTDKLEITAVDVRQFKRLADVHVETGAHRNLLLVAGKNTAGKSSLMDALSAALGGKDALPADPVRHGADKAEIVVALDGGRYTITRTITGKGKDAKTSLRIVGPDGAIASPQGWLDALVSGRFLDPVAFLAKDAKAQRQILLALVGVDVDQIPADAPATKSARIKVTAGDAATNVGEVIAAQLVIGRQDGADFSEALVVDCADCVCHAVLRLVAAASCCSGVNVIPKQGKRKHFM